MRNFLNTFILAHFGLALWQLLSLEDEHWYFENWVIAPAEEYIPDECAVIEKPLSPETVAAIEAIVRAVMTVELRNGGLL
jgi:hypothetical protein